MATVAVVGAGIGGLAAAVALRQRGFDVRVFERAEALGEVGAGIQITPNAVKVLRALGLEPQLKAIGFQPKSHIVRDWATGAVISQTPMRGVYEARFGAGFYNVHRADIHQVLANAIPREIVRLGSECIDAQFKPSSVLLSFADGSTYESDIAIGADGIHSALRKCIHGQDRPRFTGIVCWRGLTPAAALDPPLSHDVNIWYGPHALLIAYHVRGGELVNWAATIDAEEWRTETWRGDANPQEVMQAYAGWDDTVLRIFDKARTCFKTALYDRDPLKFWTKGRATLLGDAAHPMLPYLAQGAGTAIEDGYSLAALLASEKNVEVALQQYENLRRDRTARIQLGARMRGRVSHLANPVSRTVRNLVYRWNRWRDPERHTYKVEWIHGYDITADLRNHQSRMPNGAQ